MESTLSVSPRSAATTSSLLIFFFLASPSPLFSSFSRSLSISNPLTRLYSAQRGHKKKKQTTLLSKSENTAAIYSSKSSSESSESLSSSCSTEKTDCTHILASVGSLRSPQPSPI